jgi:hypothetical protein
MMMMIIIIMIIIIIIKLCLKNDKTINNPIIILTILTFLHKLKKEYKVIDIL